MIWYELTRWWAYRHIRHPKMRVYTTILPLVVSASLTVVVLALPIRPPIVGDGGIVNAIVDVLVLLPGFYIAALAAVSTFQRPEMDEVMPAPAPKVSMKFEGKWIEYDMTRRMFLSYLFSYLAIITLLLVCICYGIILIQPNITIALASVSEIKYGSAAVFIGRIGLLIFLFFWCGSIFISTLHGVYFMTERMHQPN